MGRGLLVVGLFGLAIGAIFADQVRAAEKYPFKRIECIVAVEASADGYTLGWGSSTLIANKLQGISPFDYHDFTMLGTYASYFPVVLGATTANRSFKTIEEVISFAKAHPGELSMSTGWLGGAWWVAAMSFLKGTGLEINAIPTAASGAMSVAQVAGGHTDLCIVALGAAKGMIEGGQVRLLATLGEQRLWAPYEQVPTIRELGYDVSYESPNFAMGPPKMPKAIVDTLVAAVKWEVDTPDQITAQEKAMMGTPIPIPPDPALQKVVLQAKEDLAKRLGIAIDQIDLVELRAVVWPDRSLGCPQPGMGYVQVQVDGLLIRFQAGGHVFEYHSGGSRPPFLCENPAATSFGEGSLK